MFGKKNIEKALRRVAKAFKDVILNEERPKELYWNVSVPYTSFSISNGIWQGRVLSQKNCLPSTSMRF